MKTLFIELLYRLNNRLNIDSLREHAYFPVWFNREPVNSPEELKSVTYWLLHENQYDLDDMDLTISEANMIHIAYTTFEAHPRGLTEVRNYLSSRQTIEYFPRNKEPKPYTRFYTWAEEEAFISSISIPDESNVYELTLSEGHGRYHSIGLFSTSDKLVSYIRSNLVDLINEDIYVSSRIIL